MVVSSFKSSFFQTSVLMFYCIRATFLKFFLKDIYKYALMYKFVFL